VRLFSAAAVLLLAACTTVPERPPVSDPEDSFRQHQQRLSPVEHWQIRARMALRTDNEGWHASLFWSRQGRQQQLDLTGPLGRGHLRLSTDRDGARLRDSDNRTYSAPTVEELVLRATGHRLPLAELQYWVRGLPAPGDVQRRELDAWGRLARLDQQRWRIEFFDYARRGEWDLPGRLFARREPDPGNADHGLRETIEVRLAIEHWELK
jgi:outer membrane lipoprotein LolB